MSKYLILVNNLILINDFKELGYTNFLFALKDYSIGYSDFDLSEINAVNANKYLLINRILDSNEIRNLEQILINLVDIKGIVFEDLGVLEIAKKHNLDVELIYFHNHAGTNYKTINFWLNQGICSVVLSNELTKDEIINIKKEVKKPASIIMFGHNQIMYSRRLLISNYNEYHQLNNPKTIDLETNSNHFIAVESNYGTVFYTKAIYNLFELNDDDYKYKIINLVQISDDDAIKVLTDIKNNDYKFIYLETSRGFLDKKTIFKLGGKKHE